MIALARHNACIKVLARTFLCDGFALLIKQDQRRTVVHCLFIVALDEKRKRENKLKLISETTMLAE